MVKEFAKAVVQGQSCHWIPEVDCAPKVSFYSFDKALRTFSVRPQEGSPMSIPMIKIADVLKSVRDTPFARLPSLPPPHLLSGDELDKRFVCIRYEADNESEPPSFIGLMMPNQHERERFYTCTKILRWALDCKRERS